MSFSPEKLPFDRCPLGSLTGSDVKSNADSEPLISCLCVTRDRVNLLQRSVGCFLNQTWANRELIILYESDDSATHEYVSRLQSPMIRGVKVSALPKLTLGTLRNAAIKAAKGSYLAQWDDDDWFAPERLAQQMNAIKVSGKPACVLKRWTIYIGTTQQAYISKERAWEGSIVTHRSSIPAYPSLPRSEDTPVVEAMEQENRLVFLDLPQLYVYTYHGDNTWDSHHWMNNVLHEAKPLSPQISRQIHLALTSDQFRL